MIFIHLFCNNLHILLYFILILCLFLLQIGVELADNLANVYGTRCNTVNMSVARRNKYNMQEALAKDGKIRTCQQSLCRTEQEVSMVAYLWSIIANSDVFMIEFFMNLLFISVYICLSVCLSVRCVISWPSSLALALLLVS